MGVKIRRKRVWVSRRLSHGVRFWVFSLYLARMLRETLPCHSCSFLSVRSSLSKDLYAHHHESFWPVIGGLPNWVYQVRNRDSNKTMLGSKLPCKGVTSSSSPWFWVADTFSAFMPYLQSLTSHSLFAASAYVTTEDCGLDIRNLHLAG